MVGLDLDIFRNETPYLFLFNFRILLRGAHFFFVGSFCYLFNFQ